MTEVVEEVVDLLEALLEERRVLVKEEHRENGDVELTGDRSLVRVALLNVLHNAAKFTAPGSAIIVSYGKRRDGIALVQSVAVQDAGPGIAREEQDLVFERFYMGGLPSGSAPRGSGLGLAIARSAIERRGGRIAFAEDVPAGARCILELPAKQ